VDDDLQVVSYDKIVDIITEGDILRDTIENGHNNKWRMHLSETDS
jgi:hypothetical protein